MAIARSVVRAVASPVARPVAGGVGGGLTFSQVVAAAAGYWPLQDDAASTVITNEKGADATFGRGNTATYSVTGPGGIYPKALTMDGGTTSSITTAATSGIGSGDFAFALSFLLDQDSADGLLAQGNPFATNGAGFSLVSSGTSIVLRANNGSGSQTTTTIATGVTTGIWHRLVFSVDRDVGTTIWFNGVKSTTSPPKAGDFGSNTFRISSLGETPNFNLHGDISGVALWHRTLTDVEGEALSGI